MRLFVAVDPPAELVDQLRTLPRPAHRGVRWTTPEQWHITLRFLGDVGDPDAVATALVALPALPAVRDGAPPEARLGPSVAWFPNRRVLQLPVAGLDELAAATREVTRPWGVEAEPPFTGHLTLARVRGDGRGPRALAGEPFDARFAVGAVVLCESVLRPQGSRYRAVETVPLAAERRAADDAPGDRPG